MTLFLALVLAHVTSEFLLQPSRWKTPGRAKLPVRAARAGIVAGVSAIAMWGARELQPTLALDPILITGMALSIAALYTLLDLIKEGISHSDKPASRALGRFLLGQFAHIIVLGILTATVVPARELAAPLLQTASGCFGRLSANRWILAAILLVVGTAGAGVAIRKFLEPFAKQAKAASGQKPGAATSAVTPVETATESSTQTAAALDVDAARPYEWSVPQSASAIASEGLEVAGYWIGILERSLLILAVAAGAEIATTAGFLVAFKSVYRFKSLDDRHQAEYYMLGTLASVTVAIVVGIALRTLLTGVCATG